MPIPITSLPHLNAALNATTAILILTGFFLIRAGKVKPHKACMISAVGTSTLFLTSYIIYHSQHGVTRFPGEGWIKIVYFSILISHTILAVTIIPFIAVTLFRALREQFDRHKRIARVTFPIWLYISVTGVIIYWMLYHLYDAA